MKIKIKSREEIEKTLDHSSYHIGGGSYFPEMMFLECGKILDARHIEYFEDATKATISICLANDWNWHQDWYEVVDYFDEEDYFIIAELDEMLAYFMEVENGN